jgi:hypothetical protein
MLEENREDIVAAELNYNGNFSKLVLRPQKHLFTP